ncbi:hypothetical protein BKA81DRAFT_410151 [Phyllosticta paracitricarpa]|uniref:Uncharacterized protein n=1 Tax=Phyllosticta paracitricarpa TaxID=2016321 RepID=A0ABR1MU79_9PEZI
MPSTRDDSPILPEWLSPEQRAFIVYVWCSSYMDKDAYKFFLAADHRYFFKRKYRLCLVRNFEIHGYQPRHPSLREPNHPLFVYDTDLPCTPASCATVSIELDEHSVKDASTCLLRVNGWGEAEKYGEVRCYWQNALLLALAVQDKRTDVRILQCLAAFNGGVVPTQGGRRKWIMESRVPEELTQRQMPPAPENEPGGYVPCAVFVTGKVRRKVLNRFLEELNMRDLIHRVSIVNIDMKRDTTYHFVERPPLVGKLPKAFRSLTLGAIREFITEHCREADLNSRYFVILDGLTCQRLPAMRGQKFERRSGLRLNCIIGDAHCDDGGGPLALRCTFNSCADILDDIMTTGATLQQYADEAAIMRCGCYCFSINHDGTVLFPQAETALRPVLEAEETYSRDVTSDLRGLQRKVEQHQFTGDPADCPPELSQPDVGEHLPSPMKAAARSRLSQWIEQSNSDIVPASLLPKVEVISRRRAHYSPDPDYIYDTIISHDHPLGATQPHARAISCGCLDEDDMPQQQKDSPQQQKDSPHSGRYYDSGIGSSQHTTDPSSRAGSESPSKKRKVDSMMDREGRDDEEDSDAEDDDEDDVVEDDNFYDIKLPECTRFTQMSCD